MVFVRRGTDNYDEDIKLHYQIELAKRGLKKKDVAHALGANYSMVSSAINGIVLKYPWPEKLRAQIDEYLENK